MDTPKPQVPAQPAVQIDEQKLRELTDRMRNDQNFSMAFITGIAASVLGAAVWAAITAATKYQIGWMAVGVGFLVGITVRNFGKGIDKKYGYLGAVLSLAGCLLGNLLSVLIVASMQESIPFFSLLSRLTPTIIVSIFKDTFQPVDLLFYGIAVYEGYRISFRGLTQEELQSVTKVGTPAG